MSDQIPNHLPTVSRRDFLKFAGATIATTGIVTGCRATTDALISANATSYGSGRYGIGPYSMAPNPHSIFIPVIGK